MDYPDDFAHYGFLSAEAAKISVLHHETQGGPFTDARELTRIALADVHASKRPVEVGRFSGAAFWVRAIEAAQSTILLLDRGIEGPAFSTARLAWECLFYAAALWKDPSKQEMLVKNHDKERTTQINQMLLRAPQHMTPEVLAGYKSILSEQQGERVKWSSQEAADSAGMADIYEVIYRTLSIAGAHASLRSLDRYVLPDESRLKWGPRAEHGPFVLKLTGMCMINGISRYRDQHVSEHGSPPNPK